MGTTDDALGVALEGIEAVRAGVDILKLRYPEEATLADEALSFLYEALVSVRQGLINQTEDEIRAALVAKSQLAIQRLAALKFGAVAPDV